MENLSPIQQKIPEQERAEKTIDDIYQAAKELTLTSKESNLTSRALAKRSGYSVGTIYRYFKKIDDVFISIFMRSRNQQLDICIEIIKNHPASHSADILFEQLVNHIIDSWMRVNPIALHIILRFFFQGAKEPQKLGVLSDSVIPHLLQVQNLDQSNTFLKLNEDELRLRLRSAITILRSPFFENDPKAGSIEHRKMAVDICLALFTNLSTSPK